MPKKRGGSKPKKGEDPRQEHNISERKSRRESESCKDYMVVQMLQLPRVGYWQCGSLRN